MNWDEVFRTKVVELERVLVSAGQAFDPAHDVSHFERVVRTARRLCEAEGAQSQIVLPAAWLHDFVSVPKNDPRRSQASRLSADAAIEYLRSVNYPSEFFEAIRHAIEAHSFSGGIAPRTIEACVVQDADRLDALGAIGLARLYTTAGLMRRSLYANDDPFCESRAPNDASFTIDHIYQKLFKIADTLQTDAGRTEGRRRRAILQAHLNDLASEL